MTDVMRKGGGIIWVDTSLFRNLAIFDVAMELGLKAELSHKAREIEQWMKDNAPWEDRTGQAREGLTAEAHQESLFTFVIELYHTVDYGIWLEVRWDGRYAIIEPAIEEWGPNVMESLTFTGLLGYGYGR